LIGTLLTQQRKNKIIFEFLFTNPFRDSPSEIFSPAIHFLGLISGRMKQKAYARAGVDIDLGNMAND
jgi:hypothetical protein